MILTSFLPLFYSQEFDEHFASQNLPLDELLLYRPLETILLPGTKVEIFSMRNTDICEVKTKAYPNTSPLFSHQKFLHSLESAPIPYQLTLPPLEIFLEKIEECVKRNVPYLWGGNVPYPLSLLHQVYPLLSNARDKIVQIWNLEGVDCSGLIYFAANGATPRNSTDLIQAGEAIAIEHLSTEEIVQKLQPGQIIGWKGHVLVVTKGAIVESIPEQGVISHPIPKKIEELLRTRTPCNAWCSTTPQSFVVRDLYMEFREKSTLDNL